MSLQLVLAANAFENGKMFLTPYPPKAFGLARISHFSHGCMVFSPEPDQMNRGIFFWIFFSIPLGIQATDIQ